MFFIGCYSNEYGGIRIHGVDSGIWILCRFVRVSVIAISMTVVYSDSKSELCISVSCGRRRN